VDQEDKIRS